MKRQSLNVTALVKELVKLSAVTVLTTTTTLYLGTYNLKNVSDYPVKTEMQGELEAVTTKVGVSSSKLAPTQSLRPKSRPAAIAEMALKSSGDVTSSIKMVNQNAIRNLTITDSLSEKIVTAIRAVFGRGYTAEVYSGGQHDHETAARLGVRRVGTRAHNYGHAADLYVVDSGGKRVTGNDLAPLAQYWLASGYGGVGLEMKGGGIHLDEHNVRYWNYAKEGGSITKVQMAALVAGKRGVMPQLQTENSVSYEKVGIPATIGTISSDMLTKSNEILSAPKSGSATLTVKKTVGGPTEVNGQIELVNYQNWNVGTNAEYTFEDKNYKLGGSATYERDALSFSFNGAHDSDDNTEFEAQVKYRY